MAVRVREKEPLPYYSWYWRDWRSNRKVQRMSWQARGVYRELLDEFWCEGLLPASLGELADIAGCSEEEMARLWPEIEPCWQRVEDGWVNRKMDDQRTAADQKRAAMARNGRAGAMAKLANTTAEQAAASNWQTTASNCDASASNGHIAEQSISRAEQRAPDGALEPFRSAWNDNRGTLSEVSKLTDKRKTKLRTRMNEGLTVEAFRAVVIRCAATPFTNGQNDRGWKVSFDWLIESETNLTKVQENQYGAPASQAGRRFREDDYATA